jgi:hypothetical protein
MKDTFQVLTLHVVLLFQAEGFTRGELLKL